MSININPIGIVRSPYIHSDNTPLQQGNSNIEGEILISDEYKEGIEGLDNFSHLIVLYHFHRTQNEPLRIKPVLNNRIHGVFASRQANRPNRIGFSVVRLLGVENNRLRISGMDIFDGTPVIDIKPYVAKFDSFTPDKTGWLIESDELIGKVDEGRFV